MPDHRLQKTRDAYLPEDFIALPTTESLDRQYDRDYFANQMERIKARVADDFHQTKPRARS